MITIALADDHVLLRRGLAALISMQGFSVVFEADDGRQLVEKLANGLEPDIVLVDINMPEMDGYDAALWIKNSKPLIKVLALSMYDDEHAIIRMMRAGARGYILKDCEPVELKTAIENVYKKGYYFSELVTGKLIHSINNDDGHDHGKSHLSKLNERETEFLKLTCSELTYKEIAVQMNLSHRTIDGYRDSCLKSSISKHEQV